MNSHPGIVTPEAVVLDFERAGVASRCLAILLDIMILGMSWVFLFTMTVLLLGQVESLVGAIVAVFSSLGLYLAYFAGFETAMQRTPGKVALGLRVVGVDGTPVRFQQAFLRAVVGIGDFLLLPFGFVAVVVTLLSARDQRVGDLAAGTLVVRERTAIGTPIASARFVPPPGYEGYAGSLDIAAMKTEHYELVRRFLLRAHNLTQTARGQVAARLANPLAGVLQHTPPNYLHPELFLVCVAAAWQRAHSPAPQAQPWGGFASGLGASPYVPPVPSAPPVPPTAARPAPPTAPPPGSSF